MVSPTLYGHSWWCVWWFRGPLEMQSMWRPWLTSVSRRGQVLLMFFLCLLCVLTAWVLQCIACPFGMEHLQCRQIEGVWEGGRVGGQHCSITSSMMVLPGASDITPCIWSAKCTADCSCSYSFMLTRHHRNLQLLHVASLRMSSTHFVRVTVVYLFVHTNIKWPVDVFTAV